MKKFLSIFLALLMVLSLYSCSTDTNQTTDSRAPEDSTKTAGEDDTPTTVPNDLKVGVLLPGSINDNGWNSLGYNALMNIKEQFGATVNYIENVEASSMQEQFELLASQGYQIVFGHGAQFAEAAATVSERYPETFFVLTSTDFHKAPNVLSTNMSNFNAGFVLGCIAAKVSKEKIVGYISGEYYDSFVNFGDGYKEGVAYIDPECKVLVTFTEDSSDAALAKEAAVAQIDQGADVITVNCNQAALGAIAACDEEKVTVLGYPSDYGNISEFVLMSGCENQNMLFSNVVEEYLNGTLEGKFYEFGFKDNAIFIEWGKLEENIVEEIQQIIKDLEDGVIKTSRQK